MAERLELGIDEGVEWATGGGIVGEVEARHVAAEAVGGLVVGERRLLGGVEGEPEAGAIPREADLDDPLCPSAAAARYGTLSAPSARLPSSARVLSSRIKGMLRYNKGGISDKRLECSHQLPLIDL